MFRLAGLFLEFSLDKYKSTHGLENTITTHWSRAYEAITQTRSDSRDAQFLADDQGSLLANNQRRRVCVL